jgi:hypothetical protein
MRGTLLTWNSSGNRIMGCFVRKDRYMALIVLVWLGNIRVPWSDRDLQSLSFPLGFKKANLLVFFLSYLTYIYIYIYIYIYVYIYILHKNIKLSLFKPTGTSPLQFSCSEVMVNHLNNPNALPPSAVNYFPLTYLPNSTS